MAKRIREHVVLITDIEEVENAKTVKYPYLASIYTDMLDKYGHAGKFLCTRYSSTRNEWKVFIFDSIEAAAEWMETSKSTYEAMQQAYPDTNALSEWLGLSEMFVYKTSGKFATRESYCCVGIMVDD